VEVILSLCGEKCSKAKNAPVHDRAISAKIFEENEFSARQGILNGDVVSTAETNFKDFLQSTRNTT
jgi:hypothetical protein